MVGAGFFWCFQDASVSLKVVRVPHVLSAENERAEMVNPRVNGRLTRIERIRTSLVSFAGGTLRLLP